MRDLDNALGHLFQQIQNMKSKIDTHILIVSDHGMDSETD